MKSKKLIMALIAIAIIVVLCVGYVLLKPTIENKMLLNHYCTDNYKGYKVVYTTNVPANRKSSDTIYVEKVASTSNGGKNGTDANGYYIAYNKNVKAGKHVTSYIVYNPKDNAIDDVIAVVDNGAIR